jgi:hypothetical protein
MLRSAAVRTLAALLAVVSACALAGCGGSGRLSKSDYRDKLTTISREAAAAQNDVGKALQAKTVAEIARRLRRFAKAERKLADEVAALKPPKEADAANAGLAEGLRDFGNEVDTVVPKLAKFSKPEDAITFLNRNPELAAGGREINKALSELSGLGLTSG